MHPTLGRGATAALLSSLALGAHAASFDCQAAKTPTEKTICGSPTLSTLDEQLAREYERALHALSPAGAAKLTDSQRSWLRYATLVCVPRRFANEGEPPASCLEAEFKRRLEQLAQAGVRLGPYVFNRIDRYAVARSRYGSTYNNGFATQHEGYPQIDAPIDAATSAWNARERQTPHAVDTEHDSDNDVDFTLGCVGPKFISVEKFSSEYSHGNPHADYYREKDNAILAPSLRDLAEEDVFAEDSGWEDKLPDLFWHAYLKGDHQNEDRPEVETAIRNDAAESNRWLLTPAGLQISFDAYEAGCYACNPGPLTVPWSALKPMLASPEFAACKAPPAATP